MRRQDQETRVAHPHEHHQAVLRRVVVTRRLALRRDLVAVLERGLVAVMAVRDEDRLRGHHAADGGVRLLVGHDPEFVFDAEVVGRHQRRPIAQAGLDLAMDLLVGVGIEPEHRTEVESGRMIKCQPVSLRTRERLLVGIDLPLSDRLQANPGHEPLAGMGDPVDFKRLMINVKRRVIVLPQDALAQPVAQEPGGPLVAGFHPIVAGLVSVELEPDDVKGTRRVEAFLQGAVDHVVGRRHHVGQGADAGDIITDSAKGTHIGHRIRFLFSSLRGTWSARRSECQSREKPIVSSSSGATHSSRLLSSRRNARRGSLGYRGWRR